MNSTPKPSLSTLLASESLSSLILSSPIFNLLDLASLSLVSKNFRLATTPFLYSRIVLHSPHAARKMINTIIQKPETYASFISQLYFTYYRGTGAATAKLHHTFSRELSLGLASILPLLTNLEYILVHDFWGFSAVIFSRYEDISLELSDFRMSGITFSNEKRVREFYGFLGTQRKLRFLRLGLSAEPVPVPVVDHYDEMERGLGQDDILPHSMPLLTHFDGPIFLALRVIEACSPLEHIRVRLSSEFNSIPSFSTSTRDNSGQDDLISSLLDLKVLCASLGKVRTVSGEKTQVVDLGKTLKALTVFGIPDEYDLQELQYQNRYVNDNGKEGNGLEDMDASDFHSTEDYIGNLMHFLALKFPLMRHVGVLNFSCHNYTSIHSALMEMHCLRSIEFSIYPWNLGLGLTSTGVQNPSFPAALVLKTICIQLKMYCPTLRYFIFTLRYPQPQPRYSRIERIVWIYSPASINISRNQLHNDNGNGGANANENGNAKHTGWEGEWVMGDARSNWDEMWLMDYE